MSTADLDFNPQFQKALHAMEELRGNVFITGRAGTGKSTLLNYFRERTKKKMVVLAPTGVAAINVKGQTIHSFFKFKPGVTLQGIKKKSRGNSGGKNIYEKLQTIVIDEISMVRADLLDCVDKFLRLNGPDKNLPFGGIQMIFIGDLYQLPPVVTSQEKDIFKNHYKTPYFFSSQAFRGFKMEMIELEKIYRQKNGDFIRLLNTIRNNSATEGDLEKLNERYDATFEAPLNDFYIYLTSTNDLADGINHEQLQKLPGKTHIFRGNIDGEFGREYLPTGVDLELKVGAQIMMLNNDNSGRWINGTIGKILKIHKENDEEIIVAQLENGKVVEIEPFTWEIFHFFVEGGQLDSKSIGSFTQYPVRLAFAITIHKSQGKTFQKVIIDIGRGTFAHGQMYVALSRCTTFSGLVLKKQIQKHHIRMDYEVMKFLTRYQYRLAEQKFSKEDKISMIEDAIQKKKNLNILYLKAKDEKSRRGIRPIKLEKMEYKGFPFLGLEAYCLMRKENRVFNVDRILEIGLLG